MKKQTIRKTGTRRAIIEAFRVLVNCKDFDRITVREITDLAGVSRNSFYSYFRNTEDLLNDVVHDRILGCYWREEDGRWCAWDESKEALIAFFDENRDFLADVFRGSDGFRRSFFFELCLDILDLAEIKSGFRLPEDRNIFLAGGLSALLTDWLFNQRTVSPRAFTEVLYTELRRRIPDEERQNAEKETVP